MSAKHTPGPWEVDGYHIRQRVTGSRSIAEVAYTGPHHTPPHEYPKSCRLVDEANARLIASAPNLLEVVIKIDQWPNEPIEDSRPDGSVYGEISVGEMRAIRAAIAKATGKEDT